MASVELRNLIKTFTGRDRPVVDDVSLTVGDGQFVVLLGPSGCGKTTILRMIAGLEEVDGGDIIIDGASALDRRPQERDFALVFQQYALYPHMTVEKNIGYPLKNTELSKADRNRQIDWAANLVGIGDLRDRMPAALSGGEQQRVAIGRAIVRRPRLFLLDEPLSNLDAQTRLRLRAELRALQQEIGTTTIMVTHDQADAMAVADRIVVLADGKIQQVGSPDEVYHAPVNTFVAGFLGSPSMNLLPATVNGQTILLAGTIPVSIDPAARSPANVIAGVRPESIEVRQESGVGWTPVRVHICEPLGSEVIVHVRAGDSIVRARCGPRTKFAAGAEVYVRVDPMGVHLFDATTGRTT